MSGYSVQGPLLKVLLKQNPNNYLERTHMFKEAKHFIQVKDGLTHKTQEYKKTRKTTISLNIFNYQGKASSYIKHYHFPTTPKESNK